MNAVLRLLKVRLVTVEATSTDPSAPQIIGPESVARFARKVLPTDREGFLVLHLDSRGRVRSAEVIAIGTLNSVLVHPREVFKAAILSNANAIILCHNHPSGETTPSEEDIQMTNRLREAGVILGIEVLDHVIVTDTAFHSMRQANET